MKAFSEGAGSGLCRARLHWTGFGQCGMVTCDSKALVTKNGRSGCSSCEGWWYWASVTKEDHHAALELCCP